MGSSLSRSERHGPFSNILRLAYLLCYAVVPVGLAWLVVEGFEGEIASFWSTVLLASFGCYGLLPWLPTRPPRALEPPAPGAVLHKDAESSRAGSRKRAVEHVSQRAHGGIGGNHIRRVGSISPVAGIVLGLVAASIAAGSVLGRYHYAADAIVGAAVAIVAFLTASAAPEPSGPGASR